MEANRKNAKKVKEINRLKQQTALHTVTEFSQMTEDYINIQAKDNSDLNSELDIYDDFRDFKRFVTTEFQGSKQEMAEITSDKAKPLEIHPTPRNKTFLNNKLSGKPRYKKQSTLKENK